MFVKQFGQNAYNAIQQHNHFLVEDYPISVKVYNYLNDICEQPKCRTCNAAVKFNSTKQWLTYCSKKCRGADSDVTEKRRATNTVKYGAINYLTSVEGLQKSKNSHLQRYGATHYNKTQAYVDRIKSGDIVRTFDKEKYRKTVRVKFYRDLHNVVPTLKPLFTEDEYVQHGASTYHDYGWQCKVCNHNFERWLNIGLRPICPHCMPKGTAHERKVKDFLHNNGIEYVYRSRKLLGNGLEIDIFIPSKNIGIEINGLFFHKEQNVGIRYHLDKTIAASNNGIRLIHIFGDELYKRESIVFSRLKHLLGLVKRTIYARKCEVIPISNSVKSKFLNKYHIQGDGHGSIHLGLFYHNKLVAVMDFGKQRPGIGKTSEDTMELIRFATISHFTVVGGAGKLLKAFRQLKVSGKLVSYADRRWSVGNVYEKLGFNLTTKSNPNYWYTKNFTERLHRVGFQRSQLATKLSNYDPNLSERDNMINNKFYRVWDCGTLRYELTW
jgi:hypothetical protein